MIVIEEPQLPFFVSLRLALFLKLRHFLIVLFEWAYLRLRCVKFRQTVLQGDLHLAG